MISMSHALLGFVVLGCSALFALGLGGRGDDLATDEGSTVSQIQPPAAAEPETGPDGAEFTASESGEDDETVSSESAPAPPAAAAPAPHHAKPAFRRRILRVTAYCDRGATASGVPSGVGQCAAPQDVPFGSKIYIPALRRTFVVTDRTHPRFRHNTVDIFIPSEDKCLRFGRSYLECHIIPPSKTAGRLASR